MGCQPLLGSSKPEDSPLYDSLAAIGFDCSAIVRLLNAYKPRLLQTWADITLAAVEKGRIEQSPQAFFTYYIKRMAIRNIGRVHRSVLRQNREKLIGFRAA